MFLNPGVLVEQAAEPALNLHCVFLSRYLEYLLYFLGILAAAVVSECLSVIKGILFLTLKHENGEGEAILLPV